MERMINNSSMVKQGNFFPRKINYKHAIFQPITRISPNISRLETIKFIVHGHTKFAAGRRKAEADHRPRVDWGPEPRHPTAPTRLYSSATPLRAYMAILVPL